MAREVNAPNQQSTIASGSTAAGLFRSEPQAERAIDALTAAGFSKKDIGVAIASDGKADTRSGVTEKIRSLFSPNERQEYDSGNDLDVLQHMGLRDADASFYRNSLYRGGILVTVNAGARSREADSILHNLGAEDISKGAVTQTSAVRGEQGTQHIQLLGEMLRVYKDRVHRGSVTLKKNVVTEHQQVEVPVTREEVVIERHPVNAQQARTGSFEPGKEVTVNLEEDRVRVEKQPVVREEVNVGKRQVQQTQRVGGDVKHEELKIDRQGDVNVDRESEQPRRKVG
ncbi:MAG TPA: YsnF/AvaK domain-containing protein [Terriglobales bacterium]|nr:YsnF/AvaK domain-containing protein [Terriglobales bacterium]